MTWLELIKQLPDTEPPDGYETDDVAEYEIGGLDDEADVR